MLVINDLEHRLGDEREQLEKRFDILRRETREVRIDMDDVQRTMQTEHQEYVDRRRKIQGDIQIRNDRIEEAIDDLKEHVEKFSQAIETNQKALKVMQKTQMLEHLLSAQELEDRK